MKEETFDRNDIWRLYDMGYKKEAEALLHHVSKTMDCEKSFLFNNMDYRQEDKHDCLIANVLTGNDER